MADAKASKPDPIPESKRVRDSGSQPQKQTVADFLRALLLVALGAALMEPYLAHGTIGGSDAIKYSNGVADFVTQVRAGVFPVWIGQSDFAIYGGEFPPRFALYLQHLSALVDILTGRKLPLFAVLNVALTVSLIGGLLSCYLCLRAILRDRPWTSMCLAILYASCPGVLGLPYSQDLYMSFSTLPFLPIVFLGIIRSFGGGGMPHRGFLWLADWREPGSLTRRSPCGWVL